MNKRKMTTKGKIHFAILVTSLAGVLIWLPLILVSLHFNSEWYFVTEILFWWSFCAAAFETFRFYTNKGGNK